MNRMFVHSDKMKNMQRKSLLYSDHIVHVHWFSGFI